MMFIYDTSLEQVINNAIDSIVPQPLTDTQFETVKPVIGNLFQGAGFKITDYSRDAQSRVRVTFTSADLGTIFIVLGEILGQTNWSLDREPEADQWFVTFEHSYWKRITGLTQ